MSTITIAKAENWSVLYVDGKKVIEDYNFGPDDLLKALGIEVKKIWVEDEWLNNHDWSFPLNESDLPQED